MSFNKEENKKEKIKRDINEKFYSGGILCSVLYGQDKSTTDEKINWEEVNQFLEYLRNLVENTSSEPSEAKLFEQEIRFTSSSIYFPSLLQKEVEDLWYEIWVNA